MHLVKFSDPLWFVMENVDLGDVSEEDSNGSVIGKVMEEAGFETRTISGYITIILWFHCLFGSLLALIANIIYLVLGVVFN